MAAVPEGIETLAQVAARYRIAEVVVQDEFTHDVIAQAPDGRWLAFDAT